MQVLTPHFRAPGALLSEPTSSCAAVVADTIIRTVGLGVTITDTAVDGDVTCSATYSPTVRGASGLSADSPSRPLTACSSSTSGR